MDVSIVVMKLLSVWSKLAIYVQSSTPPKIVFLRIDGPRTMMMMITWSINVAWPPYVMAPSKIAGFWKIAFTMKQIFTPC